MFDWEAIGNFFLTIVLPIAVIGAVGFLIFLYVRFLKKKNKTEDTQADADVAKENIKPVKNREFLSLSLQVFFNALKKALPEKYLVFPNIGAELLFDKSTRRDIKLSGEFCDFVVCNGSYDVIMVIDLGEVSSAKQNTGRLSAQAIDYLKSVNIAYMPYGVSEYYSIDALRLAIAETLNPTLKLR